MNIKEYLQQHPQWKKRIHGFIMHPVKTRPYWWFWWLAHFSRFCHLQIIDIQQYYETMYRDTNP